jgi:cytochrome oxidase assembly protein ShyY1
VMDVGWLALILVVAIVFAFFTLVQHWQRVVRRQAWSIKRLSERVEDLSQSPTRCSSNA